MTLAEELTARGLVEHASADIETILGTPRVAYSGFDPSSDSLQIGNLAAILTMKRLADAGHTIIFLAGGATGGIGDPKEQGERPMKSEAEVAANTRAIKKQFRQIFGTTPLRLVDNADWLDKVKLIPFLREVGKHVTVNDLVKRDIIRKRLETPDESISYTEFSYALLQGLDYLTLNEKYDCDLQVGASDQWTNILTGVDLIRKTQGREVFAFTIPLVTDASGKKFGKSEGNAVWLDPEKTPPFRFYQFWINLPDDRVETYLKVYTFLPLIAIDALMELHRRNPGARQAQETLARLVTEIVHGPAAAAAAADASTALFGGMALAELSREARELVLAEAPSLTLAKHDLEEGVPLAEILAEGGLAKSKGDARRLIEGKGITLSGLPVTDPEQKLSLGDLPGGHALVKKGRQGVLVLVLK
jgi:tyrosyl-tRNA synthetase